METLVLNARWWKGCRAVSFPQPQDGDLNPRHYLSMMSSALPVAEAAAGQGQGEE